MFVKRGRPFGIDSKERIRRFVGPGVSIDLGDLAQYLGSESRKVAALLRGMHDFERVGSGKWRRKGGGAAMIGSSGIVPVLTQAAPFYKSFLFQVGSLLTLLALGVMGFRQYFGRKTSSGGRRRVPGAVERSGVSEDGSIFGFEGRRVRTLDPTDRGEDGSLKGGYVIGTFKSAGLFRDLDDRSLVAFWWQLENVEVYQAGTSPSKDKPKEVLPGALFFQGPPGIPLAMRIEEFYREIPGDSSIEEIKGFMGLEAIPVDLERLF